MMAYLAVVVVLLSVAAYIMMLIAVGSLMVKFLGKTC